MKSKFLLLVSLVLSINVFAQSNPCPTLEGDPTVVSAGSGSGFCFVRVTLTGDVAAPKSTQVVVTDAIGNILTTKCFQVPAQTTTTFETPNFTCNSGSITITITQFTSSNGLCQGGSCTISRTIDGDPPIVTPVKLTSFEANGKNRVVSLKWSSESEIDFRGYQIEMNDGTGFRTIGTVLGKNNGLANNYRFEYNSISKQSVQFRLKLIDIDNKFSYSKTALVKGENQSFDFSIYPNPSNGANTNILVSGLSNDGRIQIIDMTGKVLKTLVVNSNNVKVGDLPTGVYMVKVSNTATAEQVTKRMVIVN